MTQWASSALADNPDAHFHNLIVAAGQLATLRRL
jgi:hypothetical protein